MNVPEISELKGNNLGRFHIKKHYPEFYEYLINKYKHIQWKKFSELLYLYNNDMNDRPKCKCCNNTVDFLDFPNGYRTYCSVKCQTNDPDIIKKSLEKKKQIYGAGNISNSIKTKQTKLERYGDSRYNNMDKSRQTKIERYGDPTYTNREKAVQTTIERYGVDNAMKIKNISKKSLVNKIKKYGEDNISNQIKIKQTCIKKYGVNNVSQLTNVIEKIHKTKKLNHSFGTSSIEKKFEKWLKENSIKYKTQYKSDEYPFYCDFYFPDRNLYFEIQGFYCHGEHPYNFTKIDDLNIVKEWKNKNTPFYNECINTWTIRDPMKRQWAKDHNLNWMEVFSCDLDDVIKAFNSQSQSI